jgi:hypothetical protein
MRILLCFICLANFCFAQGTQIKVLIKDSFGQKIQNATVQLKNSDFNVIKFGFTDSDGKIKFNIIDKKESFVLITSYLGFKPDTTFIDLRNNDKNDIYISVNLKEDIKQLKEIYVKPKFSIRQSNDTTSYNVNDFTTPDNRNLEDVIKKMPGMQVSEDGNISFKGKKITKILMDGDDVTGNKYKLLTKNIAPNQVTDIQAIEHYIEDALLKGIINSDDVVLNLKIKNPKVLTGNVETAYGTNNRNDLNINLISYLKGVKSFTYAGCNNIGRLKSSDFSSDLENQKFIPTNELFAKRIFPFSPFSIGNLALNNSSAASLNLVSKLTNSLKLKANLNYNKDDISAASTFNTQYFKPNNISIQDLNNENNSLKNLQSEIYLDYLINPKSRILFSFDVNSKPQNYSAKTLSVFNDLNKDSVFQNQNTTNNYLLGNLKYTLQLHNKAALLVSSKYLTQDIDMNFVPISSVYKSNPQFNGSNSLNQNTEQVYSIYNFNFQGLKRINNNFFEINSGLNQQKSKLNTNLSYLINSNYETLGVDFINKVNYSNNQLYLNAKYVYDIQDFKFKTELKNSYQKINVLNNDTSLISLEPSLSINWKFKQIQNLNVSYNYKNTPIDNFNFYSGNILTDFRNLNTGINQLYNYGSNNFNFNYGYNDFSDKYLSLNLGANFIYSKKGFIYENFFENNFYISKQFFYNGFKSYGANLNIKKFIPLLSTSFNINYSWNNRDYFNKVGPQINEYNGINQNINIKGDTGFDLPINFNLGFQLSRNNTNENGSAITENTSYKYSFITSYKLSKTILPFANLELARVNKQNYTLLNALIQINPKKGKFKYSLDGKNLLNLKSFDNYFIDNAQSSTISNQILGRYIAGRIVFSIQ